MKFCAINDIHAIRGKMSLLHEKGHLSPTCPMKDKTPKDQWAMKREQVSTQSEKQDGALQANKEESSQQVKGNEPAAGWTGSQVINGEHTCLHQSQEHVREAIMLDSRSTMNLFCNEGNEAEEQQGHRHVFPEGKPASSGPFRRHPQERDRHEQEEPREPRRARFVIGQAKRNECHDAGPKTPQTEHG